MAAVTITAIKNGPYVVTGEVEVKDAAGNTYPASARTVLCRCGASTNKPFCDGCSHQNRVRGRGAGCTWVGRNLRLEGRS